jgi:hypothetical protein
MDEAWYVARNKQKLGSFSLAQLREQASSGALQPTDMVLRHGDVKWVPAKAVHGLFAPLNLLLFRQPQPTLHRASRLAKVSRQSQRQQGWELAVRLSPLPLGVGSA